MMQRASPATPFILATLSLAVDATCRPKSDRN
jgi:hypothetical protein